MSRKDRPRLICENPNHPFKQKWYYYDEGYDSARYCSSCNHYLKRLRELAEAILHPRETLYGEKLIHTDEKQFMGIVKEIFEEQNNGTHSSIS